MHSRDFEIFYRKTDINGSALSSDLQITGNNSISAEPDVVVDQNDNLHVVWYDDRTGSRDIYFNRLNNSGSSLTGDVQLTFESNLSTRPRMVVDNVASGFVVWEDSTNVSFSEQGGPQNNTEIWFMKINYTGSQLLKSQISHANATGGSGAFAKLPTVLVDGLNRVHILWSENSFGGKYMLFYAQVNGSTGDKIIDSKLLISREYNSTNALSQSAVLDQDNNLNVVWIQQPSPSILTTEVYYLKAASNSSILVQPKRLTFDSHSSGEGDGDGPSIVADTASGLDIVWNDNRVGGGTSYDIFYSKIDNLGNTIIDDLQLSNGAASSINPIMRGNEQGNFITWADNRDGNEEIYYKRSIPFLNITDFAVIYSNLSDRLFRFGVQNIAGQNLSGINGRLNTGETLINSTILANLTINEKLMVFVWYSYINSGNYTVYATGLNQDVSATKKLQVLV